MHKSECALDTLVIVVLGQETHLTHLWQFGQLERELRLRLLHVRAQLTLHIVVELVRFLRTAPDTSLARVVDSSGDQTASQQESNKKIGFGVT